MRFLMKVSMPVEAGNAAAKNGFAQIPSILAQQKPEAAYFFAECGRRTGLLIINLDHPSQIPALAEPWFLTLNAAIELTPVMLPEDLQKAGPAIADAVKNYG